MSVSIVGTGSYLPERILSNGDLEKMVDTSDEWIFTRTGIRERHIAREDETVFDMGAVAARRALDDAGVHAEQVDLIVTATVTPDHPFPSTACLVQNTIGARNAFCFDISAACSGFLYAMETGRRFINSGTVKTALIMGAEKLSSITDWKDRNTCVLFGDGAGAVVIKPAKRGRGFLSSVMGSDGALGGLLTVTGGDGAPHAMKRRYITMNGKEVFKHAVRCMSDAAKLALDRCGMSIDQVNLVIPHQANRRIMEAVASRLNISMEKFYLNLERVGNLSAASVPVALDEAARSGAVKRGDVLLLIVFGGGFTWGASILEW